MNRIAPVIWCAAVGYATALWACVHPEWTAAALTSAVAGAVVAMRVRAPLLGALACTVALVAAAVAWHAPARLISGASPAVDTFTLQLTSAPTPLADQFREAVQTGRTRANAHVWTIGEHAIDADVVVLGPLGAGVAWGDTLTVRGRAVPSAPGAPLGTVIFVEHVVDRSPAGGLLALSAALRERFRVAAEDVPGVGGELVTGLAIGDTSRVSPELAEAMRTSSLTHLMAVSGANCALVVAVSWALIAALGLGRRWRIVGSLLALAGFMLLVTPQPSVLRAAVMALIALITLAHGRRRAGLAMLAVATLGLTLCDPWLVWNAGFALSVAATAGIIWCADPLSARLRRWCGPLAPVIAVPLAAQLSCTPILVLLAPTLSIWAIPANVLAGWLAPAATLLGVLACLILPIWSPLGTGLLWGASIPASVVGHVAIVCAGLPWSRIPWPAGTLGMAASIALSVAVLAVALSARRRVRVCAAFALCIAGCVMVGLGAVGPWVRVISRPTNWVIAACPVGQGDAFVLRSAERIALIDTGPDPHLLAHCLETLEVRHIDLLVLTHYDRDHVAGVPAVLGRTTEVLVGPIADASDERIRSELSAHGAIVREVRRGDFGRLGNVPYTVLWPNSSTAPGNDSSVTLFVTWPGLSAIFLGDLGADAQRALIRAGVPPAADVVKVAHHGSKDQAPELYQRLRPSLGLIGVGVNDYGHPTPFLLDVLSSAGITSVRTDTAGLALVAPGEGGALTLWTERALSSGL